ncbi:MAG: hypothetical protein V4439_00775 [Patescibacteria group bacterium]
MKVKIKKIVYHLRQQPVEDKKKILHLLTIVCVVVMIILWSYSLSSNFNNPDTIVQIKNDIKPLSAIKDNMVDGYKSISVPVPYTTSDTNQDTSAGATSNSSQDQDINSYPGMIQ